MNILFFQHGDFGEAYRRFASGGPETYRDQRASVNFVSSLRDAHKVTTVAVCNRLHDEEVSRNLHSVGVMEADATNYAALASLLHGIAPELLILRTPNFHVLRWAGRHNVPVLPMFADMFARPKNPWSLLNALRFRRKLMAPNVPCVANHSLNASFSLTKALHFSEDRIVPWDRKLLAINPLPKSAPSESNRLSAFFAGALLESKGVSDCLDAVRILKDRGIHLAFTLAGSGDTDRWVRKAKSLGISDRIILLGRIPNEVVRERMRASDFVVVPSRHEYAEGLPNTLCEGLASRTPVVISDHPAFASRLKHGKDCAVFRGGDPLDLAETIEKLSRNPALYVELSKASASAYRTFFFGTVWTDLIRMFIDDPRNETGWVAAHSLARLRRDGLLSVASSGGGV